MTTWDKTEKKAQNQFLLDLEAEANMFNLKCLAVLCGLVVLCAGLNRIGIFTVDHQTMSIAVVLAAVSFSLPIIVCIIHDWAGSGSSIFRWWGFKYLILVCAFIGITTTCIVLTFHAVLLMVLPGIFAAQYAYRKHFLKWELLGTAALVPVAVYGGFFFGLPDQNYFPDYISGTVLSFTDRLAVCPPGRILSLFEHYVVPRFLSILIINIVLSGVIRRNADLAVSSVDNAAKGKHPVVTDSIAFVTNENQALNENTAGSGSISASRIVRILRLAAVLLCAGSILMALLSQELAYRTFSTLTAVAAFFLISASRATQGHYRNISSAYMAGAGMWGLMEACRIAALLASAKTSGIFTVTAGYLSFLPDCLFVTGLILFSRSEYNQLHFRRIMLHAFAISYIAFMIAQKIVLGGRSGSGMTGFSKLSITLYFFVIVFTIVMVLTIFIQTKFRGYTFGTNCSAIILVVFNFVELTRLYYMITGQDTISLLAESTGVIGLVIYSRAQSDPALIFRKREPEPIRPEDHVQNKVIWGAAAGFLLISSVLFVIGFFDARDVYLILLAVLAYVVIYKSIQAEVYNTELIEQQHMENQRLEQLVNEKTAALEKPNAHLKVTSETDELTGLHNRRYGMNLLEQMVQNTTPFAFLLMDLNHFKDVNDTHGHGVGDQVLKETGARLSGLGEEVIPIRLGGDEFLVIVPQTPVSTRACEVAEKICRAMNQPIMTTVGELVVTACIGIAVWPEDTKEQIELYHLADMAMYGIKHRSRESDYSIYNGRASRNSIQTQVTSAGNGK